MDINIPIPTRLQLLGCHKKFLIKLLVELIINQRTLGGNKGAVGVAVFLVPDIHDGLAFFIHLIQHFYKILLIIAVVPIAFRNLRLHLLEGGFDDIVHFCDGDALPPQRACLILHEGADEIQLLLCEFYHGTISGFINCNHDLLHIPCFVGMILFDDIHKPSSFFGKK